MNRKKEIFFRRKKKWTKLINDSRMRGAKSLRWKKGGGEKVARGNTPSQETITRRSDRGKKKVVLNKEGY